MQALSWFERPELIQALTSDIMLCSWAKTLNSVSASLHRVPGHVMLGYSAMDYMSNHSVDSLVGYGNLNKLWPAGSLGSYADFTFYKL